MVKEYDELLRTVSLCSPVGIYIVQGRQFQFVNAQFCKDVGYSEQELLTMDSMQIVHPDDRATVRKNAISMLKGKGTQPYEFRTISKDGSEHWIVESVSSIMYRDRRASLANYLDVTERRQFAEVQAKLLQEERILRQKLQDELTNRSEYTKALVHELKTPLTAIIATSDILTDLVKGERLQALANNIGRSAAGLDQRIDEMLDLARGEVGILKNEPEDIDITCLALELLDEMRQMGIKEKQTILLDSGEYLPKVHADPSRVKQVLVNLVGNSIKYTQTCGEITIRLKPFKDIEVLIEVEDNGPGIAFDQQEKIFDPYRSRQDGQQRAAGLGIGLALSKRMVELNGGRLWFVSVPEKGTIFSFTLPVSFTKQGCQHSKNRGFEEPATQKLEAKYEESRNSLHLKSISLQVV